MFVGLIELLCEAGRWGGRQVRDEILVLLVQLEETRWGLSGIGRWVGGAEGCGVNGWYGLRRKSRGLITVIGVVKGAMDGCDGLRDGCGCEIAIACPSRGGWMEGE